MARAERGDVWIVDLGFVAKVRPCLVLSIPPGDRDRDLLTLVPHTTSTRQSRFEVACNVRFLKSGAFDAQNLVTVPSVKLVQKLGALSGEQLQNVTAAIAQWLGMEQGP